MGLLDKASNIINNEIKPALNKISFWNFVTSHNIQICAVFTRKDDFYYITNSIGFDGLSILSSFSTSDFWTGLLPSENQFFDFKTCDNSILSILQFFSFNLKDNVDFVQCLRIDNKILFLCNNNSLQIINNKSIIEDFSNIDFSKQNYFNNDNLIETKNISIRKYTIDIQEAITSFVKSKLKNHLEISELYIESISNEIMNRLSSFFAHPSLIKRNTKFSASILFPYKNEFSYILLMNHLIVNLAEVVENFSELLEINDLGKIDSYLEMEEFINAK
ncbi:MAG: hypothetical protein GX677_03200 [Treponema sp.]|jgi:hypothetical protein|nr:hypothetical protein [Treponema sp.]